MSGLLSDYIRRRINKLDSNFNLGLFGDPGCGKSLAGIVVGKGIDKTFKIKTDILYNKNDYFDRADELAEKKKTRGKVLILDEAGTLIDAQTWWDKTVQGVVNEMRTNRWQNMCCIIISPNFKDIANRARMLMSGYLVPNKTYQSVGMVRHRSNINYKLKTSSWNFYHCETDPRSGELFRYLMRVQEGGLIRNVKFILPPPKYVKSYKRKSFEYKRQLQQDHKDQVMDDVKRGKNRKKLDEMAREVLDSKERFLNSKNNIDRIKIGAYFNIGRPLSERIMGRAELMEDESGVKG